MKEVYIAYGENNEVLYVGQGNIGRHKHCLSGTSHNRDLNRYYFKDAQYLYSIFDIENTKEGYFIKFKDVF